MKVEYINPFIGAAESVIQMVCSINPKFSRPSLKPSPLVFKEVVIVIGVIGKIKGQIFFEMSEATARGIASIMMGGMQIDELDEISKSAISEIGNMIMGNASTMLANNSISIDITPPTLLAGDSIEMSNKSSTIVIPMELEGLGYINININVEETA